MSVCIAARLCLKGMQFQCLLKPNCNSHCYLLTDRCMMSLTKGGCAVLWSCSQPADNVATALTLPFLRGNLTEWHRLV